MPNSLGGVGDVIAHLIEVLEGGSEAHRVRTDVVGETVVLEELLDSGGDEGVPELRHAGEEVVLNLEVEVGHEPVHPPRGGNVGRVLGGVVNPGDMLVSIERGLVGVAHREVDKDVHGPDPVVGAVQGNHGGEREVLQDHAKDEVIADREGEGLGDQTLPGNVPRVEEKLPADRDQEGGERNEEEGLEGDPRLGHGLVLLDLLGNGRVEGDQREGVQVDVVLQLLGSGVMPVVLRPPPRGGHAAPRSVGKLLNGSISHTMGAR